MGIKSSAFDPTQNIPQLNSRADEWIAWHKTLKAKFGKKVANSLWMKAWAKRGSNNSNTSELRSYMDGNGIKLDASAWNKVTDFGGGAMDFVGNFFQAGQILAIGLGVIIVGGIGLGVYNIMKKPNDTIGVITTSAVKGLKGGI